MGELLGYLPRKENDVGDLLLARVVRYKPSEHLVLRRDNLSFGLKSAEDKY